MSGQSGIVDLGDAMGALERAGQLQGVLRLPQNPELQRLQAALQQVALLGIEAAAMHQRVRPDSFHQVNRTDHDATAKVAMASQVLGATVHDQVEPMLYRILQDRRGERVVDGADNVFRPRNGCDGGEVKDAEQWIGGGFHEKQPGVRAYFFLDVIGLARADAEFDAQASEFSGDQAVSAAIHPFQYHGVLARVQQPHHDG